MASAQWQSIVGVSQLTINTIRIPCAHTVSPLDNVVLSVLTPLFFFAATGVAKPLFSGAAKGVGLLKPLVRLSAKRLEAMANILIWYMGGNWWRGGS